MDINKGSHIHSVRLFNLLGILYDYAGLTIEDITRYINIAREREKNPTLFNYSEIEGELKELARLLS